MHLLSPPPMPPTTSNRGLILRFVSLWLAGLILSIGRFDWAAQPVAVPRGFVLSGYIFSLFFLAVALLGWLRDWWRQRAYWIGVCAGTILLNFPRHALSLDRIDYYSRHPVSYGAERNFIPTWLGGGAEWHGTDWWFATLRAGICLWLVISLVRRNQGRGSGSAKSLLLVATATQPTVASRWVALRASQPKVIPGTPSPAATLLFSHEFLRACPEHSRPPV
jgi:hypothetical protein